MTKQELEGLAKLAPRNPLLRGVYKMSKYDEDTQEYCLSCGQSFPVGAYNSHECKPKEEISVSKSKNKPVTAAEKHLDFIKRADKIWGMLYDLHDEMKQAGEPDVGVNASLTLYGEILTARRCVAVVSNMLECPEDYEDHTVYHKCQ